jgi:hypothetical protein
MAKRKNPHLAAWQEGSRERLRLVLERKYHGRQSLLANALGVSHTLVSFVLRSVQPPTRNLMARLGAIEGVNPRWADTGEGEPFVAQVGGTLPVSDVLLPGPPAEHAALMTGERFAVPSVFDRPSCYYWRLPSGHPALAVGGWRLSPNDLLLLETSRAVIEAPGGLYRKRCVLDGRCLNQIDPAYGTIDADEKSRLVFNDGRARLRFLDPIHSNFAPRGDQAPKEPKHSHKPPPRRKIMTEKYLEERAADPWSKMPAFSMSQVLAVQLLMVRC